MSRAIVSAHDTYRKQRKISNFEMDLALQALKLINSSHLGELDVTRNDEMIKTIKCDYAT